MFSSNTAEVINIQTKKNADKAHIDKDLFSKLLMLHKKLKVVAQYESITKSKYKVASLSQSQLDNIKMLESKSGYSLLAFEQDLEVDENKNMILNRIDSLLDEYLSYCKPEKSNKSSDDFNKFFDEQS